MRLTAYRDALGFTRQDVDRGHFTYRTRGGGEISLEREPLLWGFGLNGGYVLGEASRPIPKVRLATPRRHLSLFGVPLGAWKGETFMGQLTDASVLPETAQSPSLKAHEIADSGTPLHPFLFGYRASAQFGEDTEFYANWIVLTGGSLNGQRIDQGYGLSDYLTAIAGVKDATVEGNIDLAHQPNTGVREPRVRSAANSDVGFRMRSKVLEGLLHAEDVRFYVTRGSKGVHLNYGSVFHRPAYYIWQDVYADWRAVIHSAPSSIWSRNYRYTAPTPAVPNDTVGFLFDWGVWKVGVEYLDSVNVRDYSGGTVPGEDPLFGHRSFTHSFYKVGFYEEGDPLGSALGGEARYGTFYVQWDPSRAWRVQGWLQSGDRPFRDDLQDWILDHPGKVPVRNWFTQLQLVVEHHGRDGFLARSGVSAQRQSAVLNESGRGGTGFRWFQELGWTWTRPR